MGAPQTPVSEPQLHRQSIWTVENRIYLGAQSQYVASKTTIIFLEQQRLKLS